MAAGPFSTSSGHYLTIPSRSAVRAHAVETERLLLTPIDPADGPELWTVVDQSRWHLERWLPWVPFNNTKEASQRYAEACSADWDAGRAVRFGIRDRGSTHALARRRRARLVACISTARVSSATGFALTRRAEA